ncbi:MAG: dipeptide ABC transporter ATP-binding protein [Acetobacteraceae bacterium]
MNLLEVEDLCTEIRLPGTALPVVDGVSFHLEAGEVLGLVGESGSGKTMTGLSILRLLPANGRSTRGRIRFDGQELTTLGEEEMRRIRGNKIGVVFQDPMTSLNPNMTIGDQVAEPVRFHRRASKAEALARAVEVLGLAGVPEPRERLKAYPHQLSGGLRQRVMIAMALSCEPKLLIADEPTTALDVTIQAQILELLGDLTARLGMGLILITHDMGVVAGRADRVMVMYAGRIVEVAGTEALFEQTRHPYTEALLSSIPQLNQDKSQVLYSIPGMPPDLGDLPRGCRFAPRCAFAEEECRSAEPELEAHETAHAYACFHPRNQPSHEPGRKPAAPAARCRAPTATANANVEEGTEPAGGKSVILDLRNVSKDYPLAAGAWLLRPALSLKAVSEVSLQLEPGETFGLVGESGCGKTTLGRMAVALEAPTAGQVMFEGTDLASMKGPALRTARRHFQFMFQDPYASLDPRMRVGQLIEEPLRIQSVGDGAVRRARVKELLREVGLTAEALAAYPHEFSGGQRQRIGLARALALSPKMIVADEPVSALDVSIRSQILNLMKRLQADHGLTYLVISHDLSVVRYLADRVGVMYLGSLVEIGAAEDIYERAAHPYTAGLIEAIPIPRPGIERAKGARGIVGELPSAINPPSGCRFRTRCPLAAARCRDEVPRLRNFGGRHWAACHFPLQAAACS